jgi:hypothetical protein
LANFDIKRALDDITDEDFLKFFKNKLEDQNKPNKRNWRNLLTQTVKTNLKILSSEARSLDFMVQVCDTLDSRGLQFLKKREHERRMLLEHLITRIRAIELCIAVKNDYDEVFTAEQKSDMNLFYETLRQRFQQLFHDHNAFRVLIEQSLVDRP